MSLSFRGAKIADMINQNPLFETRVFYSTSELQEVDNGLFVRACKAVSVDPDVVIKQARLITELQDALAAATGVGSREDLLAQELTNTVDAAVDALEALQSCVGGVLSAYREIRDEMRPCGGPRDEV